ncbi:MAG: hypothetical protein IJI66_14130 [Erysipelotrichaceae bacterium]|nr:hypothetical protein [Erysipelotrichaceae bacterium]
MYEVSLLNLDTQKQFSKWFDSEYLMRKFINKVKYSKKLKLCYWCKC